MQIQEFTKLLNADFYTGVPDSLLRPLCDYIYMQYGLDPKHHIVAANEGNIINPLLSLLSEEVYAIPILFIIGWRGELGVFDEPQHVH